MSATDKRGDVTNVVNVSSFVVEPLIVWKLVSSVDREDSRVKGVERDSKKPQHRKKARKHESPLFLERKIVKKEMYATYPLNRQCFSLCSARISEVVFHS